MPATSTTHQPFVTRSLPGVSPRQATRVSRGPRLHWTVDTDCPGDWAAMLAELDGGFLSSPACIPVINRRGTPIYCRLTRDGLPVGLALVIGGRCTMSAGIRHYRLASPPVLADGVDRQAAVEELVRLLSEGGAAEVELGSYDGLPDTAAYAGGVAGPMRLEFPVPIDGTAEAILSRCSDTHRRYIRRGLAEMWKLVTLDASTAPAVLHMVQGSAIERVSGRDQGRAALPEEDLRYPADNPALVPWGTRAFAAYGPDGLLAAALLGWGGRRVYYVMGGSTSYGYSRSAAAWLHWSLMDRFGRGGSRIYNLGGTPASGADSTDPAHGLYRFKAGFGAAPVACRGTTWHLRPAHLKRDALIGEISKLLRR